MDSNKGRYSIEMMARSLNVSPRSYYDHKRNKHTARSDKKEFLLTKIQEFYFKAKGRNGSPRITGDLKANHIPVSRTTVATYMRELGMRSRIGKRFRVTTNSNHTFNIAPNLLNRQFSVDESSKVWVGDITYIHTKDGFIYLTTVIDLFDRKVIGWSISTTLKAEHTVVAALKMATTNRAPKRGMIFHSDRGVQYACEEFVTLLGEMKIVQSMSRKGNCRDNPNEVRAEASSLGYAEQGGFVYNAVAENFFKSLKCELIYGNKLISAEQMEIEIFEYIECWYNRARRHSALSNLTIDEFWNNIKFDNHKNVA